MRGAYTAMRARLRRRGLGQGAPRLLVRGHQGRQDPGRSAASRMAVGATTPRPCAPPEETTNDDAMRLLTAVRAGRCRRPALAKLPAPVLDDAAKAKAAEAAAKTAWQGKVDAYQLCKVAGPRRAAYNGQARHTANAKAVQATAAKPAASAPAAAPPQRRTAAAASGTPVAMRRRPARRARTRARSPTAPPEQKPLETSGAHSPAGHGRQPAQRASRVGRDGAGQAGHGAIRRCFRCQVVLIPTGAAPRSYTAAMPCRASPQARAPLTRERRRRQRARRARDHLHPGRARPHRLRRQARTGHADDAGRAPGMAGARLPAQPAAGALARRKSNPSPSTGTSAPPP